MNAFKPQPGILNTICQTADRSYHLSFNPSSRDYGAPTTAIVIQQTLHLVLIGDHRKPLAQTQNLQGAFDYFIANLVSAHHYSEHTFLHPQAADPWSLRPVALETLGADNIARLNP